MAVTGMRFLPPFVCLFTCMIPQTPVQLGSPNTTYKFSTTNPGNPFIWVKGQSQRSKSKLCLGWSSHTGNPFIWVKGQGQRQYSACVGLHVSETHLFGVEGQGQSQKQCLVGLSVLVSASFQLVMTMMVVTTADVARYEDVVQWFYSEPAVGSIDVHSRCRCGPWTSAVEQHDCTADEPSTSASSSGPAATDWREVSWSGRRSDVLCSAVTSDTGSWSLATAVQHTTSYCRRSASLRPCSEYGRWLPLSAVLI